eukprot:UC4_evm1s794
MQTFSYFSPSDVAALRDPEHISMANREATIIKNDWNSVMQSGLLDDVATFPSNIYNFDNYRWASSVIGSRAWTLSGKQYFVPGADFFNFDSFELQGSRDETKVKGHTFLKYHKVNGKFAIVYSDRNAMKGEQLFESYGENSNLEYLAWFGFVPHHNPSDCVKIKPAFSRQRFQGKEFLSRATILQKLSIPRNWCLPLPKVENEDLGLPNSYLDYLRVISMRSEDINRCGSKRSFGDIRQCIRRKKLIKSDFKEPYKELSKKLKFYTDSINDDNTVLGSTENLNLKNSILIRQSQKKIIMALLNAIKLRKKRTKKFKKKGREDL